MEEIAKQFREELQEFLDRYKNRLSVPRIMYTMQGVFRKTLSFRDNPGNYILQSTSYNKIGLEGELKYIPGDEPNAFSGPNPICGQGPDGCCGIYKGGWDKCKGCLMYHGERR